MYVCMYVGPLTGGTTRDDALARSNATFSLLLPGNVLDLTALNNQRQFHDKGNKAGAKLGWSKHREPNISASLLF